MIVTNSTAVLLMSTSSMSMSMSMSTRLKMKLFLSVILLLSLTQGCTATIATTNKTKQQQQQQQQQQEQQELKQKQNDKNSNTATNTDSTSGWEQENDRSISSASTTTTPAKNGRWAVIHIGPSLTGTSAIQASIAIVEKTLLQQDKFEDAVYHATNNHYRRQTNRLVRRFQQHHQQHEQQRLVEGPIGIQNIVGCFRPDAVEYNITSINTTSQDVVVAFDTLSPQQQQEQQQQQQQRRMAELSCHPDSLNLLKEVSTVRNHNLLLSSDYLADPRTDIDALYKFIQSHWENHKVVAYYRRYYDWLLSLYDRMHRYENENNPETRIPISDFIEQEYETQALFKTLYVTKAIERYRFYFPYNEIINMYEMDDVRIGFYCKALIGGTITGACEQFQKYYNSNAKKEQESVNYYHHESKRTAENRANYVYNDLVYYAKKRGLIPSSSSTIRNTEEAIAAAKYYQEQTNGKTSIDFHYSTIICPRSKQANWILSKSKEVEEELFPEYYKRKGQNEIEEHYEHIKKTYHLCHIDADAVLDLQPEWVLFFQLMNNNTTTTNNSNLPVTVTSSSSEKQSNPKKNFLKRNTKQTGIEIQ